MQKAKATAMAPTVTMPKTIIDCGSGNDDDDDDCDGLFDLTQKHRKKAKQAITKVGGKGSRTSRTAEMASIASLSSSTVRTKPISGKTASEVYGTGKQTMTRFVVNDSSDDDDLCL